MRNYCIDNLPINIKSLYFLIFHCVCEGKSINWTLNDDKEFGNKIGIPGMTLSIISRAYNNLRKQIKINSYIKRKK